MFKKSLAATLAGIAAGLVIVSSTTGIALAVSAESTAPVLLTIETVTAGDWK